MKKILFLIVLIFSSQINAKTFKISINNVINLPKQAKPYVGNIKNFIIEVDRSSVNTVAADTVDEITFYNNGSVIPYNIQVNNVYDSKTNGIPYYWNDGIWGYAELNDGIASFTSTTSTAFDYNGSSTANGWARFALTLSLTGATSVCTAVTERIGRTPSEIKIYTLKNQSSTINYSEDIASQNDLNLNLIWDKKISITATTGNELTFCYNF